LVSSAAVVGGSGDTERTSLSWAICLKVENWSSRQSNSLFHLNPIGPHRTGNTTSTPSLGIRRRSTAGSNGPLGTGSKMREQPHPGTNNGIRVARQMSSPRLAHSSGVRRHISRQTLLCVLRQGRIRSLVVSSISTGSTFLSRNYSFRNAAAGVQVHSWHSRHSSEVTTWTLHPEIWQIGTWAATVRNSGGHLKRGMGRRVSVSTSGIVRMRVNVAERNQRATPKFAGWKPGHAVAFHHQGGDLSSRVTELNCSARSAIFCRYCLLRTRLRDVQIVDATGRLQIDGCRSCCPARS
jgi:hypothetical protein